MANADNRYVVWYPGSSSSHGNNIGFYKYREEARKIRDDYSHLGARIWDTKGENPVDGQTGCEIK